MSIRELPEYGEYGTFGEYAEGEYDVPGSQATEALKELFYEVEGVPEHRQAITLLELLSKGSTEEAAVNIAALDIDQKLEGET